MVTAIKTMRAGEVENKGMPAEMGRSGQASPRRWSQLSEGLWEWHSVQKELQVPGLPWGPVAKTVGSQCRGPGFDP